MMLDDDPQTQFLMKQWTDGGSALPVVRRLLEGGAAEEAATLARAVIGDATGSDREELEAAILKAGDVTDEWIAALKDFSKAPSAQRWAELLTFIPEDVFYQRLRSSIMLLTRFGCDGNTIFRCATTPGILPDMYDIVASGTVDPEVILQRGAGSPARVLFVALAARAAFARGDRWTTLKLLREASKDEGIIMATVSIDEIRDLADDEFNAELDKIGVPSPRSRAAPAKS
jgi:hypothetical protein